MELRENLLEQYTTRINSKYITNWNTIRFLRGLSHICKNKILLSFLMIWLLMQSWFLIIPFYTRIYGPQFNPDNPFYYIYISALGAIILLITIWYSKIAVFQTVAVNIESFRKNVYPARAFFNRNEVDIPAKRTSAFSRSSNINGNGWVKSQLCTERIIQSMDNLLIILSQDEKIKFVNKTTTEILGYSEEELLGKQMSSLLVEDIDRGITIENLINKGNMKNVPAEFLTKDQKKISVSFSGSVIFDSQREIDSIICMAQDISERKQAEAAIIKAHDELEIRVAERTFELEEMNKALKTENIERLETEKKLMQLLEEKEVLLKEVHHRVKNNLQIISSLLQLNSKKIKDEESLEVFRESQRRIKSIAMVHERLYQTKNFGNIDIKDYFDLLTKDIFKSFGLRCLNIILKMNLCELQLSMEKTIPLGIIINEMVTNSIKHAFPNNMPGEISLEVELTEPGKYVLIYHDNGIGFNNECKFSSGTTLGLKLIKNLTEQIDGTLEMNTTNGVKYKITF